MEIRDKVVMACPNCAIKHLSAALACMADAKNGSYVSVAPRTTTLIARAVVNIVEHYEGYTSHLDYAVGLMVLAEEAAIAECVHDLAVKLRGYRVDIMSGEISPSALPFHAASEFGVTVEDFMNAHIAEARRELPELMGEDLTDDEKIAAAIRSVKETYFPVIPEEEKGGESVMACAKKKAVANKAACKGGKTVAKKAACKGGKCCKK